jgi:DNA-directed RNA polymerase subunit RPC12/RpoP
LVTVAKEINCSHCGAPLPVQPGEILVTCKYCGFTSVIETGKPFEFEHSLVLNSVDVSQVFNVIRNWMGKSFIGPKDLQKKSTPTEQNLIYLPFWVVSAEARTHYKGVLERIAPPSPQEGDIADRYDWLVLARRQTDFPTRSYHLSLSGKMPFDAMKIDRGAKVLNSEMTVDEAVKQAQDEIENLHEYLSKDKVDKIVDIKTDFDAPSTVYLHAPVWFVTYSYRNAQYQVFLDGSSGEIIKGEMPSENFKSL